jgi:hypothetical protein
MRNARLQLTRRYWLLLDDLADRVDRIAGLERRTTHQQFVEYRSEGIDVGGRANFPVFLPLFRRHNGGRDAALGLAESRPPLPPKSAILARWSDQ